MPITALPTPPTRQDPDNFAQRGDEFLAALPVFATEANALAADVTEKQLSVADMAAQVLPASAAAMAAVNFVGIWSSLSGSLAVPASVYHNDRFWILLSPLANVATAEPGVSSAWAPHRDDVGEIVFTPFDVARPGTMKANGAEVSRVAYAWLWNIAQAQGSVAVDALDWAANPTKFYIGNGTTTFNLPDYRGSGIRAWDDGAGIDPDRGLGTLQQPQNASHSHTGTTGNQSADHNHAVTVNSASLTGSIGLNQTGFTSASGIAGLGGTTTRFDGGSGFSGSQAVNLNATHAHTTSVGGASANHNHSFTTAASGGSETRVRTVALLACIRY